jgi:hypothetical protein
MLWLCAPPHEAGAHVGSPAGPCEAESPRAGSGRCSCGALAGAPSPGCVVCPLLSSSQLCVCMEMRRMPPAGVLWEQRIGPNSSGVAALGETPVPVTAGRSTPAGSAQLHVPAPACQSVALSVSEPCANTRYTRGRWRLRSRQPGATGVCSVLDHQPHPSPRNTPHTRPLLTQPHTRIT